jgi:NADH-quinone oxidoreductase subunit G
VEWPHLAGGACVNVSGVAGALAEGTPAGPLPGVIDNYYLTNPIARASETMAACVAEILVPSQSGVAEAAE